MNEARIHSETAGPGAANRAELGANTFNLRVQWRVKHNLRAGQNLHLLGKAKRRSLLSVQSVQTRQYAHMSNINLITRVGQGLLAVATTGVTLVILQFAMLTP